MSPLPSGFNSQEEYNEYMKNYNWVYRLRDRLKTEALAKFNLEIQKLRNSELETIRQEATILGLNCLLEQIPFITDVQRQDILKQRDKILCTIDKIIKEQAERMDAKFAEAKTQYAAQYDNMFNKVMDEYKSKIASDPKFRAEAEERIKSEVNRLEISIPFANHGVV